MTAPFALPRDVLARALNGDLRAVVAFEQQAMAVEQTQADVAAQVDATDAIQDATVITLSPNTSFNNERVLKLGPGLRATDDGSNLTITVNDDVPHVRGGFIVNLTAQAPVNIVLPDAGVLATQDQPETLTQKTLNAPSLTNIRDYADDAAAAVGNVPVGGVYRTGSTLKVRVA